MKSDLTKQHCVPCGGGVPPLSKAEAETLRQQTPQWTIAAAGKQIERTFTFKSFQPAVDFINHIAVLAEAEGHHPDLHLERYKHVRVCLSTHAIGGLSANDFIPPYPALSPQA